MAKVMQFLLSKCKKLLGKTVHLIVITLFYIVMIYIVLLIVISGGKVWVLDVFIVKSNCFIVLFYLAI